MTKIEIIEETKNYYCEDVSRRGLEEFNCFYLTKGNKMCAVGRCLINPSLFSDSDIYKNTDAPALILKNSDDIFKEQYRGHDMEFWKSLQIFHDCVSYWNDTGLTVEGEYYYKTLKEYYKKIN